MKITSGIIVLIDNSNTRTKVMLSVDGRLGDELQVVPTAGLTAVALRRLVGDIDFDGVLVSSVVPSLMSEFESAFGDRVKFLSPSQVSTLELDYEGVATLGADRLVNVVGLALRNRFPSVAVDLGTATTFDVLVQGKFAPRFIGGAIAPGFSTMCKSLAHNTAQLPELNLMEGGPAIGRNTQQAMYTGCLLGYVGLVEGVLSSIADELGCRPYVVATGGDSALIASKSSWIDAVEPLLTFKGLNEIACKLF